MRGILLIVLCLTFSLEGQAESRPASGDRDQKELAEKQLKSLLKHAKKYCRSRAHAEQVFKRAETLSSEYLDEAFTLEIKMEKGLYYRKRGAYRRALQSFSEGLPYLSQVEPKNRLTKGWFLIELGKLLYHLSFYQEAYDRFQAAQCFFEAQNYLYGQSVALNNQGLCRLKQQKPPAALQFFQEGSRLRARDEAAPIYQIHNRLYEIRAYLALDSTQRAAGLLREIEKKPLKDAGKAVSLRKLIFLEWGSLYYNLGQYKKAWRYFDSARASDQRSYDPLFDTRLQEKWARLRLAQQHWDQAEKHARQGLAQAKAYDQVQYLRTFHTLLAQVYENKGQPAQQLEQLQKLNAVNQKFIKRNQQFLKNVLTLKERTLAYAEEINDLQDQSASQQDRIQRQTWINLLTSVLVLISLGALLFFYRLNRKLKRYRGRLLQYGQRSLRAANSLSNVLFSLDENGKINFFNRAAAEFSRGYWGKAPELGDRFEELIEDEDKKRYWATRLERARSTEGWQEMSEIHTRHGATYYLFTFASIFIQKEYRGVMILGTDVTEPHRRNMDLQQKSTELEKALQTKDRMLSILAHDLKEGINSSLELVNVATDEKPSAAEYAQYFELLQGSLSKTQALLYKTLDWVRQQGQPQTGAHKFKFYRLAQDLNRSFADLFEQKEIQFKMDYPEGLELKGEPGAIMTVLRNLLSNAAKFTPATGGVVQLLAEVDHQRQEACISVKDNGVGMDKEQLEALLGQQSLASTPGTSGEKGTGMGIKICQQLLAQNQSRLQVISEKDAGSQFYFRLPLSA